MSDQNETQNQMAQTLAEAGQKAEKQKKEARARAVKGAHLTPQIQERIQKSGYTTEDRTGFIKVSGPVKGKVLYFATNGGRIDLSGFSVQHPAIVQLTAEQAKEKHLGKVRGQVNFDSTDDQVLEALDQALADMQVPLPEAPKASKPKKESAPAEATTAEATPATSAA